MIDLYTWATPNGRKVSIMLEECALPYEVIAVDITTGEQSSPEFAALNPNRKIPVIVDHDGPDGRPMVLIESGAILVYLAEKSGRFMPRDPRSRSEVLQWLMFQMGSVGPMLGQAHHFLRFAPEKVPYAIARYDAEARRIYAVLESRLQGRNWLAGDDYSIADIACFPWIARHEWQHIDLADYPQVKRWFHTLSARPAVQKGMEVPA
ncbi:MAG: glutathione S-transferase N-terminal domain-containing protein [Rhodocyclaceae bacterium]|nr:glutathione S-transferase N-terminal domain-containing protein [Rhodocyclaceae bacterium]MCP5232208.1 glutathione S-transferase N-terminal domain-containing protein [Zoogloeaceae bacterium]MCP5240604.1 glutathione S-transferase N-terminal domain-containing protein [Zoogloeaceae bacterium]MCP5253283.1 glutathione S-transferase N-terminal domain-containing protein [Zoogloeaceae bacterium]MCP5293542.1 glutathione S-transferase N-terminal domain-containing protein [Zoogloeaceae bacterium]